MVYNAGMYIILCVPVFFLVLYLNVWMVTHACF